MKTFVALILLFAVAYAQDNSAAPGNVTTVPTAAPATTTNTTTTTVAPTPAPTTKANTTTTTVAPTPAPTTKANTTTTPKPTTPATNTTTPKPTTLPTNTTTPKPTTPATNTTTPATTTTPGTPPTSAPPSAGTYEVKGKDDVPCIILKFSCKFVIPYTNTKNESQTAHLDIEKGTVEKDESFCSRNDTDGQQLTITWKNNSLTLLFVDDTKAKKSYAEVVQLDYYTDSTTFPGHPKQDTTVTVKNEKAKAFTSSHGRSYQCKAETDVDIAEGVVMSVTNVQSQAFRSDKNDKFSTPEICSADDKTSNIVPIAVGCALAALVLIVLVAYCIGRRRSRQKGYQSV